MFFALLGINIALLISGSIALIQSEGIGGSALLVSGFAGLGFMMWYYQSFTILADSGYSVNRSECADNSGSSRNYNKKLSGSRGSNRRYGNGSYSDGGGYSDSGYSDSGYSDGGYSDGGGGSDSSGGSE